MPDKAITKSSKPNLKGGEKLGVKAEVVDGASNRVIQHIKPTDKMLAKNASKKTAGGNDANESFLNKGR